MARIFTVIQLIERAQQRSDTENDGHISAAEWKTMLSTIYGEFYAIFVELGSRHFETTQTLTATGSANFNLPDAHLTTIGIDYEFNASGAKRQLTELMAQERNIYTGSTGHEARAYSLVGSQIVLFPTPSIGQVYTHHYVPQPLELSSEADSTELDVISPDGEAFITWGMTVLAKSKSNEDIRDAERQQEKARERVYEWAILRSLHETKRHVVEDGSYGYLPGDWWLDR